LTSRLVARQPPPQLSDFFLLADAALGGFDSIILSLKTKEALIKLSLLMLLALNQVEKSR